MSKTGIVRDPVYLKHSNGPDHPESPKRLLAIDEMLEQFPLKSKIAEIPAREATFDELAAIHSKDYIKYIEKTAEQGFTMLDMETGTTSDSFAAASRAAGGTMEAINSVLTGRFSSAFAFVRPPGHHAEAGKAMGFCLFNNVAVGAAYAIKTQGLERVLIVDWDVHHGNGTMNSFFDSNKVLYFSIHEDPHYPGTGHVDEVGINKGEGYTVNVPLAGGRGDSEYMYIFQDIILPVSRDFAPELVLISAGFDAHKLDPLAGMELSGDGFGRMTAAMKEVADDCCGGKIVLVLEGGYSLPALSESVSSVLSVLLEESSDTQPELPPAGSYVSGVIEDIISVHKSYWKSL